MAADVPEIPPVAPSQALGSCDYWSQQRTGFSPQDQHTDRQARRTELSQMIHWCVQLDPSQPVWCNSWSEDQSLSPKGNCLREGGREGGRLCLDQQYPLTSISVCMCVQTFGIYLFLIQVKTAHCSFSTLHPHHQNE